MARWIDALARTRQRIIGSLGKLLVRADAADSLAELEETLIGADVPARLAMECIEQLRESQGGASLRDGLRSLLLAGLAGAEPFSWSCARKPLTIMIVGINGSGKTTTCAKLARQARNRGLVPLLAATDTFRAAGADQLEIWADRIGCPAVVGAQGADAAAVAYDALDSAIARGCDVVVVDTAGRMHTKKPLMQELGKVRRAMEKRLPGAPDETWVVLDATAGHNAVVQAREFHAASPLTGAVIAKLDGSSRAGFVFSVARELGIPVRMVGLGEGMEDLVSFDPAEFVDGLLGIEHAQEARS